MEGTTTGRRTLEWWERCELESRGCSADDWQDKFIIRSIQDEGESGIDLGQLGQKVRNYDPTFKSKRFGYSTFQKYVQSIKGVVIEVGERNQKSAVIKKD